MKKLKLIVSIWALLTSAPLFAQPPLVLQLPDTIVNSGDTLRLDIIARQFTQIVSAQFSINWNPNIIRYVSFQETNLPFVAIGNSDAANGNLRFSWFDVQGTGQTLADGRSIVQLKFFVNGNAGDQTNVNISGTPLAIQVFRATNEPNKFEDVTVNQQNGIVAVAGAFSVIFNIKNVDCNGNNDGAVSTTIVGKPENASIRWTGPNNFQSQQEDIANLSPGTYTFEIRDGNNAILLDSTLTIQQPAAALQIQDVSIMDASCDTPSGSATVSVSGGTAPYRFNIGRGFINSNQINNLAPGDYELIVRDTNDCEANADFTIEASDAPTLNLADTMYLCTGENLMLDAGEFSNYQWSNGATTRSISVNQIGIYSVTVSNAPACTASDTIRVLSGANIQALIQVESNAVCPGDSIRLTASGGDLFQWQDASGTLSALNIANPVARPKVATTYSVTVSSDCGSDTASIAIQVFEITSSAMPDTCIGPGETLELSASGGVEYFWFLTEYPVSDNRIANPTTMPEDSTSYFVMITDVNGCEKLDTINVMVANNPLDIKAVNMITPNGDGKNDTLEFEGIAKYGVNSLKVYNRWGDLIYNKLNYQDDEERFDGTYKGKLLPTGNYFYVLAFRNGEIKQTLTILRQ